MIKDVIVHNGLLETALELRLCGRPRFQSALGTAPTRWKSGAYLDPEPYKCKISGADKARACEQRAARAPTELW
jgi:hypothetical protein